MQNVHRIDEAYRVDGAVGVALETLYYFQYAGPMKSFEGFCIRVFAANLSQMQGIAGVSVDGLGLQTAQLEAFEMFLVLLAC